MAATARRRRWSACCRPAAAGPRPRRARPSGGSRRWRATGSGYIGSNISTIRPCTGARLARPCPCRFKRRSLAARRYRSPRDRAEPSRRPLACPPGQRRPAAVRRPQADSGRPRLDACRPRSDRLLRRARDDARLPRPADPRRARAAGRRNLARSGLLAGARVLPLQARRSENSWPLGLDAAESQHAA
jgi:hypothetical protein